MQRVNLEDTPRPTALAIHIGADVLTCPEHAHLSKLRGCHDTFVRMARLTYAAGIQEQQCLLGWEATCAAVTATLKHAAASLAPGGLLVVTFSGHSVRKHAQTFWCLQDGELPLREVAACLAAAHASAQVIVVADTCYGAALRHDATLEATLVVIAACGENQHTINRPTSEFIERLEHLTYPDGRRNAACTTYRWLHACLQDNTPDVERPEVWVNRAVAWQLHPFVCSHS